MERGDRTRRRLLFSLITGTLLLFLVPVTVSERAKLGLLNVLRPLEGLGQRVRSWFVIKQPDPSLERELQDAVRMIADLHTELRDVRASAAELKALGQGGWQKDFEILTADVIVPLDSSRWRDSMVIARGAADGVTRGALVVHFQHVVGRVTEVSAFTSRVVLSTDPQFKVGALCLRPGAAEGGEAEIGIAEGAGQGVLRIRWVSDARKVEPGDHAVTTRDSLAGVPKGLLLGRVAVIDRSAGAFPAIIVRPEVSGRFLERIQILVPKGGQ